MFLSLDWKRTHPVHREDSTQKDHRPCSLTWKEDCCKSHVEFSWNVRFFFLVVFFFFEDKCLKNTWDVPVIKMCSSSQLKSLLTLSLLWAMYILLVISNLCCSLVFHRRKQQQTPKWGKVNSGPRSTGISKMTFKKCRCLLSSSVYHNGIMSGHFIKLQTFISCVSCQTLALLLRPSWAEPADKTAARPRANESHQENSGWILMGIWEHRQWFMFEDR